MKIFAIGDLHLSSSYKKPMDVFGGKWTAHASRIEAAWLELVGKDDLVLIPGDISWGMRLEDSLDDLEKVCQMPGIKVMTRGNHDYWWSSLSKVRSVLSNRTYAIQNDKVSFDGVTIVGSRGWIVPSSKGFAAADQKIYDRELMRMELSLKQADRETPIIAMIHYPPFDERRSPSGFTDLFEKYGVKSVVYGHLHGESCKYAFEGVLNGITYTLCSADHLNFRPKLIMEI